MASISLSYAAEIKELDLAVRHLETLRATSNYAAEEVATLQNVEGRAKYSKIVQTLDDHVQKLKGSWASLQSALQAAAKVKAQQPQMGVETSDAKGQEAAVLTSAAKVIHLRLEESLDQALLDCRAKRLKVSEITLPTADTAELSAVVQRVRSCASGLELHLFASNGNPVIEGKTLPAEVRMVCPNVFAASVLLARPGYASVQRVVVDSAEKAADLEAWSTPSLQVFRRLTALAMRVLTYYNKRSPGALAVAPSAAPASASATGGGSSGAQLPNAHPASAALEDTLLWLVGYKDLFSKRCSATGRLLAWDPSVQYPVPPIFRPYKLPRSELQAIAADPSQGAAYHMHAAPAHLLGWQEDLLSAVEQDV